MYKSQVRSQRGFKVKKGNVEVGSIGTKCPESNTPPQPTCSPSKQKKRQATAPARALKDKSREDLGRGQVELFRSKSRKTIHT